MAKTAAVNNSAGIVTITAAVTVPPIITGTGSTPLAAAGSTTATPFAGVTIGDGNVNSPVNTLTITLSDATATLAVGASHPAGVTFTGSNGSYTLTGSAADITSELDALTLTVPSTLTGAVDGVEALTFSLSDASSAYTPAPTTATLTADLVAAPPTITGGSTTDILVGSTTEPFAGVTIADTNLNSPTDTLTITLSDANATLAVGASHPAGVTFTGGNGSYTLTGSAINITSELDALTLTAPSGLTGAVNGVEALSLSLSDVSSANAAAATTAAVTANITVPAAPVITGAGSTTSANAGSTTDMPFAGVTISDANPNSPTDTLTIQLSDANASLAESATYGGPLSLISDGHGEYTLGGTAAADTAANITAALDALTLTAPSTLTGAVNGVEVLTFSLSDTTSAYALPPTAATVTADILAPTFSKTFGYTGNIETFTVQNSGYYDIAADGAQGGVGFFNDGGLGAFASGAVYLQAGAQLEIVVGGAGQSGRSNGGGGGGSFVIETNSGSGAADVNEVIAGGGGGGSHVTDGNGGGGRTQGTGGAGGGGFGGFGGGGGVGGAAGHGSIGFGSYGAGGGGFTGGAIGQDGSVTGTTFAGGFGGSGGGGGFGGGGGGASIVAGGGGGGGYGGGGGGVRGGGGGGSFVNASAYDVAKTAAVNSGNGSVTITAVTFLTPSITGTGSTTDQPFAGVTIADSNLNPVDTLTITLSDANATLVIGASHPAGVTFTGGNGSYTLTGTAIDITSELDALTLTAPSGLTGAVNGVEALTLSLSDVSSANAAAVTTAAVTANITVPAITGAGSTTSANAGSTTDMPFAGVTISDANPNSPTDTLTIQLSDANASLAESATYGGPLSPH